MFVSTTALGRRRPRLLTSDLLNRHVYVSFDLLLASPWKLRPGAFNHGPPKIRSALLEQHRFEQFATLLLGHPVDLPQYLFNLVSCLSHDVLFLQW
jgi:hypothetical protein